MGAPSNFVSFADYAGLNQQAGQQMLDRATSGAGKLRADAVSASDAHYNAARAAGNGETGGVAEFERTGEQARKGLASYGEFMQSLRDPGARQALMEKTYGKGAVSALDSALAGSAGAGQIANGQRDARQLGTQLEGRDIDADARRQMYSAQSAAQTKENARGAAERARRRAELAKISAVNREREEWKQINDYEDKFRQNSPSKDRYDHYVANRIDPVTGKTAKAADYKAGKVNAQYGWGGAGTLKSASGGSL